MVNKCLLSLLMISVVFFDLFAYVDDSGECMLMENITTMLEEYRTYKDKISQLTEQSKGYDGKILNAQASANSAKAAVEKINNSAKTQSYVAGGLSLTSAAMNTVSIGMNSAAIANNKKTLKGLNNMHDTLSELNAGDKSVMDKKFDGGRLATEESINNLIDKAKCLNSVYSAKQLGAVSLQGDEKFFLKDDLKVGLPGEHLAVRNKEDGEQDVMSCSDMLVEVYIKGFANYDRSNSDYGKYISGCRWNNMNGEAYYNQGSKTIKNDKSTILLQSAVDAINSSFDEAINAGLSKGSDRAGAQNIGKINCNGNSLVFEGNATIANPTLGETPITPILPAAQ